MRWGWNVEFRGNDKRNRGCSVHSTAADCRDNFEAVAVREAAARKTAARNDFAVALDRQAPAGELQLRDQFGAGWCFGELARFAIDVNGNHSVMVPALKCHCTVSGLPFNVCILYATRG